MEIGSLYIYFSEHGTCGLPLSGTRTYEGTAMTKGDIFNQNRAY